MISTIVGITVVASCSLAELPERPPVLDFKKKVDYVGWWNSNRGDVKPDASNAYEFYRKLLTSNRLPEPSEAVERERSEFGKTTLWSSDEFPALAEYLDNCQPQLKAFRNLLDYSNSWVPIPKDTESILLFDPDFNTSNIREYLKISWRACLRKQESQQRAMMNTVRLSLQHARHFEQHGSTIDSLVAMASRAGGYDILVMSIDEGLLTASDAARAYRYVSKNDDVPTNIALTLNWEWLLLLDTLQYVCPDGELSNNRQRDLFTGLSGQSETLTFTPKETRDIIDTHFGKLRQIGDGPVSQNNYRRFADIEVQDPAGVRTNPFTRKLTPKLSRYYQLALRTVALQRGTMTTLAILAHRDRHGEWPPRLDAIDADLNLPDLKTNQLDPYTGEMFIYHVNGNEMTLYSAGADQKDNGGKHDPKWAEEKVGHDYVFWPIQDER